MGGCNYVAERTPGCLVGTACGNVLTLAGIAGVGAVAVAPGGGDLGCGDTLCYFDTGPETQAGRVLGGIHPTTWGACGGGMIGNTAGAVATIFPHISAISPGLPVSYGPIVGGTLGGGVGGSLGCAAGVGLVETQCCTKFPEVPQLQPARAQPARAQPARLQLPPLTHERPVSHAPEHQSMQQHPALRRQDQAALQEARPAHAQPVFTQPFYSVIEPSRSHEPRRTAARFPGDRYPRYALLIAASPSNSEPRPSRTMTPNSRT